jgi:predicted RNA-binding Zn-ribbon protein involved in translation (DUF1610 family)
MTLPADELQRALAVIGRWRADPDAEQPCPRCNKAGLVLQDHSARPHAEWYHLACPGCGLDEMIHIPMVPPTGGLD